MNYDFSDDIKSLSLTPDEERWVDVLKHDEKIYKELEITDDKYIYLAKGMIDFITLILKYDNLKVGEINKKTKRLIRVRKRIPSYIMDLNHRTYLLIGGLYIVADVIFIDSKSAKKYLKKPTAPRELYGISDEACMGTLKHIASKNVDIALADDFLVRECGVIASKWEYPDLW